MSFGQWHKAMKFTDPLFGTNAQATTLFEAQHNRPLDYDTAGAIAAGVVRPGQAGVLAVALTVLAGVCLWFIPTPARGWTAE